jgi:two-component system, chemotaxis family, chemotaxis protein CheY
MNMKKILVIEDSELLHRMYDLILLRYKIEGAKIFHAYNGQKALEMLAGSPDMDIILLDINMPVMSGLEFLRHLKRENIFQAISVIIISTEGEEDDTIRGLEAGARAYLTKPFQPNDLHALIARVMGWSPVELLREGVAWGGGVAKPAHS